MKKLLLMAAMLAMMMLFAAPVLAQVGFGIGDTENDSGGIETENAFEISGNNNNACLGQLQFGNSGNFTNQQGVLIADDGNDGFFHRHDRDRDRDSDDDQYDRDRDRRGKLHFHPNGGGGGNNADDIELSGPEVEFAPENETACEQAVQQAAAASSWDAW